jgi:hypothetical protein
MSISLKHFYMSVSYDIFGEYLDGIHQIKRSQYLDFYRGLDLEVNYNRKNTKIYMLKRDGYYCFFQGNTNTGSLCILNGGEIKKVPKTLEYYYDNLIKYASTVEQFIRGFNNKLMEISSFIRSFNGAASIHGCIVDIDYYNHVYLNPFDGKITPYYATSIDNKYVYNNIPSLLAHKAPYLMKYFRALNKDKHNNNILIANKDFEISKNRKRVKSTEIYKVNKIIKSMQYITRNKIIRSWNDNIISNEKLINSKEIGFRNLIE